MHLQAFGAVWRFGDVLMPQRVTGGPARAGFIQTTILIFILPLLLVSGLVLLQLSAIRTAQQRVQAAARQGAEIGCLTGSLADVHAAAGLTLGYLGGDYQTEFDFVDTDGNGSEESAAVG